MQERAPCVHAAARAMPPEAAHHSSPHDARFLPPNKFHTIKPDLPASKQATQTSLDLITAPICTISKHLSRSMEHICSPGTPKAWHKLFSNFQPSPSQLLQFVQSLTADSHPKPSTRNRSRAHPCRSWVPGRPRQIRTLRRVPRRARLREEGEDCRYLLSRLSLIYLQMVETERFKKKDT